MMAVEELATSHQTFGRDDFRYHTASYYRIQMIGFELLC